MQAILTKTFQCRECGVSGLFRPLNKRLCPITEGYGQNLIESIIFVTSFLPGVLFPTKLRLIADQLPVSKPDRHKAFYGLKTLICHITQHVDIAVASSENHHVSIQFSKARSFFRISMGKPKPGVVLIARELTDDVLFRPYWASFSTIGKPIFVLLVLKSTNEGANGQIFLMNF